ncbi:dTMP kinase [Nocardia nova]|uniref:dTMP kinase n=1 Tax=Nocardia nova TaxID=37330 RepID=UPI0033F30D70
MTITPIRRHCTRGPLISIEGITGVGKTYLTHRAFDTLTDPPLLLEGFSQRANENPGLGKALLGALREASGGDPFLRTGAPMAEALILLAIKRHDLDTVTADLASGRAVVEGRSVDSTAVCQALLMHLDNPDEALATATDLLELAASYRPLPDLTILITDDAAQAVARTQRRDQCLLTSEQATFMYAAAGLYEQVAATDPARCRVLDRRAVDEHEAAEQIRAWITSANVELSCLREPWQGTGAPCLCCGHREHTATPA